jgi:hypothetical protein
VRTGFRGQRTRSSTTMNEVTVTLTAPMLFDQSIGYWSGEPDLAAFEGALQLLPEDPRVKRRIEGTTIILNGPETAVRNQERLLQSAGLVCGQVV